MKEHGQQVDATLLQYLSPLSWEHINLTGDYVWEQNKQPKKGKYRPLSGKTSGLDHNWPGNIDHRRPELSICCLAMYVNCNLPGEKWSISPAFPLPTKEKKIDYQFITDLVENCISLPFFKITNKHINMILLE